MARYAYDVNTRTRLIDVHKQFNGGLKTVDTDDSLGSVYLRQAENVSLSEFGFIEKRYGTIKKDLIKETSGTLQGYWEYMGFAIYAINNIFYYRNSAGAETTVTQITQEESTYRYPTTPNYTSSGFGSQTTYRDMNAVNINNVLYIFTGYYPVYVKLDSVTNLPVFHWFSVTIPTYDEIVVTGHNLLEDNYNNLYFKSQSDIQYTTPGITGEGYGDLTNQSDDAPFIVPQVDSNGIEIKQHAPLLPFQDGGELNFNFKYAINPTYLQAYNSGSQDRIFLLSVDDVGYRASGPGSSGYTSSDKESIEFTKLHNYTGNSALQVGFDAPTIARQELVKDIHDEGFDSTVPVFSQQSLQDANAEVYLLTGVAELGSNSSGTLTQTAFFEMDVNTEKSGADFIAKDAFTLGDEFEFRLLEQTSDANNPTNPLHIPTTTTEIISDYFSNFPTAMLNSNGDTVYTVTMSITKQTLPKIRILPVGENNLKFEQQVQVISLNEGLTKTTNGYKFKIPSTLVANDSVIGYEVSLRGEIFAEAVLLNQNLSGLGTGSTANTTVNNSTTVALPALQIYKEMFQIETLASGSNTNLATSKNIGIKLKNLLAGTYDFRLRYRLQKFTLDSSNFLNVTNDDDGVEYADIFFFNVPITAEKLQDLPGINEDFLPKLKPIWSCNKVMEHYGKLMVWGSEDDTNGMPTAVFYSFPDRPTYFPSKFYLDFTNSANEPIEAVTPYMNILVAQTASQTFGIRGNSGLIDAPAPYVPFGVNPTVGTISYKSVRPVRNQLFFLSKQGIIALTSLYAVDESYNIKFVDRNIRNIVPQDSKAVGIQFDNQYWLNFPNNSITLRWYIDKKAWVQDKYQGWATNGFKGVFKYQIKDGKLEYISYPSDITGSNRAIYEIGIDSTIPTDLFQPISAKFETSFLNQNYPFHQKNYKEAKLDFTLQNEYNLGRDAIYDSTRDSAFSHQGGGGVSTVSFNLPQALKKNHRYRIEFTMNSGSSVTHLPVTSVLIEGQSSYSTNLTPVGTATNTLIWEFNITNDYQQETAIDIVADFSTQDAESIHSIVVRDVTYDTSLAFSTYVISENQTLNFDNSPGYTQATVDVDLDLTLKGRLGDWTFGESDFGDKVTAVKTIKLSGKGYNSKLYVEDVSKSKWTLESMGITYKMKKARSR